MRFRADRRQDRMLAEPAPRGLDFSSCAGGFGPRSASFSAGSVGRSVFSSGFAGRSVAGGVSRAGARKDMMSRVDPADDTSLITCRY